jgi:hypothetical protein
MAKVAMSRIFENKQWRVTPGGLEAISDVPTVYIHAVDLLRLRVSSTGTLYEWPLHLAENTWVRFGEFAEAFAVALKHHGKAFDAEMLNRSLALGSQRAQEIRKRWG